MDQISFEELELSQEIMDAVDKMGFENATEIQAKSIPLIKEGHDVIGRSQTGTGKTIAFGIPAIETVDRSITHAAQVLIMCPTRELAMQACDEMKKLSVYSEGIRTIDIYGGASMQPQISGLKNANIVIGTPGRIMDHLRRRTLRLDKIKMVVLDEADEMLSMGFREDIETILEQTPEERQTVLFSATMPREIMALTKKYQRDPQVVAINEKQVTVDNISQYYYDVPGSLKKDALDVILKFYSASLSLVFCNTKRMVDELAEFLNKKGYNAEGLHGDMTQPQRTKIMEGFKHGKTSVLVATDVAARGIDVKNIEFVINYDIPQNTEYYVHRIGRTGRAGSTGSAITLCCGRRQVQELISIGRGAKSDIQQKKMPTAQEMGDKLKVQRMAQLEEIIKNSDGMAYADLVNELVEAGHDVKTVAASVLEMHFGKPQELAMNPGFIKKETPFNPNTKYVKMVLDVGRDNRVAPNHIVGAITDYSETEGRDIGRIDIMDRQTIVMIAEDKIHQTIAAMKNCKINGKPARASLMGHDTNFAPRKGNPNNFAPRNSYAKKSGGYNNNRPAKGRTSRKGKDDVFVEYC